jgi:hypothetical protein
MVASASTSVEQYLESLPDDRRTAIARVRDVVNAKLPAGYVEGMQYGMISWCVPFSRLPETYNGQPLCLAALASQKQHMALYLMTVYGDKAIEKAFRAGFKAEGKKLDMGKSCVRFKTADALALDVIGETIAKVSVDRYVEVYEKSRTKLKTSASSRAKTAAKKPAKTTAKKSVKTKRRA